MSLVGVLCWALYLGVQSGTTGLPLELRNYSLVFSDDFDSLDLGLTNGPTSSQPHKWYEGLWFNHEHVPLDRFAVARSELSLTWKRRQRELDSSVSTFCRDSQLYHAWRYGYFEARMKWKPQKGAWPAFWLTSVPQGGKDAPGETGEIDIFEGQGDEPQTFFGTIHRWNGSRELASSSDTNKFSLPPHTDLAAYHTYGLLWVPGRVTWFFDSVPLHSERTFSVFDKRVFLVVLGMQEGTDWNAGDLTGVTAQSLTLLVDWVRVWQQPGISQATGGSLEPMAKTS